MGSFEREKGRMTLEERIKTKNQGKINKTSFWKKQNKRKTKFHIQYCYNFEIRGRIKSINRKKRIWKMSAPEADENNNNAAPQDD